MEDPKSFDSADDIFSPPQAGGEEGEGDLIGRCHPPPHLPPSKGGGSVVNRRRRPLAGGFLVPPALRVEHHLFILPGDSAHWAGIDGLLNEILGSSLRLDHFRLPCLAAQPEDLRADAFTGATPDAFLLVHHDFPSHEKMDSLQLCFDEARARLAAPEALWFITATRAIEQRARPRSTEKPRE